MLSCLGFILLHFMDCLLFYCDLCSCLCLCVLLQTAVKWFSLVQLPISTASFTICWVLPAVGALCHSMYSSLSISSALYSIFAAFSNLVCVYLCTKSNCLHLLCCLILPFVLFVPLPSRPMLGLVHCLPYWHLLWLLVLLLSYL